MTRAAVLSDESWARIEPLLPPVKKAMGRPSRPHRPVVEGMIYRARTGVPWRDLSECYGLYTTAYNCFNRWSRRGIWKCVFDQLASKSRDSLYLIDSTIVKAHRAASGGKGGRKIRRLASAVVAEPRKSTRLSTAKAGR